MIFCNFKFLFVGVVANIFIQTPLMFVGTGVLDGPHKQSVNLTDRRGRRSLHL
jgi:hypothetical protein